MGWDAKYGANFLCSVDTYVHKHNHNINLFFFFQRGTGVPKTVVLFIYPR